MEIFNNKIIIYSDERVDITYMKVLEYITNLWYSLCRIKEGNDMDRRRISILLVAKYVINYFNQRHSSITQLKLQKILYFIEAYYMNLNNGEELYNEDFKAYTYGPVSFKVYDKYSYYAGYNISEIYPEVDNDSELDEFIPVIDEICEKFGELSASQLVNLTHEKGSPWYKLYVEENKPLHVINKRETMRWFRERFAEDE